MADHVAIVELTERHIESSADVLTRSFLLLNDIWKNYKPKYEEIYPIMRAKVLPAIGTRWSYVLELNKKVIGVSLQYEMLDYLASPSIPTDLELFNKLSTAGKQLQSKMDISNIERGDAIYGLFGVIDPEYANRGYSLAFWWHCFVSGQVGGWKYYYSRISSPVSLKMLLQLGAEILAESSIETDLGVEKVWMIRIDLSRPLPPLSMITAMAKDKARSKKMQKQQASL